jgi:DNA-binding transcriptional regulator YiaG
MSQKKRKLSKLKQLRESKDLSQRALAETIGVDTLTVSTWERGTHAPKSKAILKALANVFPGETFSED